MSLFQRFRRFFSEQIGLSSDTHPALIPFRDKGRTNAAVVFLHGFSGDTLGTWGDFPNFLLGQTELEGWDIFALGYPSSLRMDVRGFWEADPDLTVASLSLRTALQVLPLNRYRSVAIIAHSMGGLVAQRAVLDPTVYPQVGHLILFACPSDGIAKSLIGALLKRQARDMATGSEFIRSLREDWRKEFESTVPFVLRVVAGERDEFAPASSSLTPFPEAVRRVVPGNHTSIVKPDSPSNRSVEVVMEAICQKSRLPSAVDSALVAVELRNFSEAVNVLLPRVDQIDDDACVQLALALESLNRGPEALAILERQCTAKHQPSSDALGVLAGRLKRRWLTERVLVDWERARSLYANGLLLADPLVAGAVDLRLNEKAVATSENPHDLDYDQAMYHAINVAFLDLMITPVASTIPLMVRQMAERAVQYAQGARDDHWRLATLGDAQLMLGNLTAACEHYRAAVGMANSPRAIDSIYSQAIRVAERMSGDRGVEAVQAAFGASSVSAPGTSSEHLRS